MQSTMGCLEQPSVCQKHRASPPLLMEIQMCFDALQPELPDLHRAQDRDSVWHRATLHCSHIKPSAPWMPLFSGIHGLLVQQENNGFRLSPKRPDFCHLFRSTDIYEIILGAAAPSSGS